MRTKLFAVCAALALVAGSGVWAFATGKADANRVAGFTCCDLCPGCCADCTEDQCCPECVQCCLARGCDASCCSKAGRAAKAQEPKKAQCCDGCCKDGGK